MDEILVKVKFPAIAESDNSWRLLTVRYENKKGWSSASWFPKSKCELIESRHEQDVGILTLPLWLFNKKQNDENLEFTNLNNEII